MPDGVVFREKLVEAPEPEAAEPVALESDDVHGAVKAGMDDPFQPLRQPENKLELWEKNNGKYGAEVLGIKEVMGEFQYKMQFGVIDGYIKSELTERGLEPSPKTYQEILEELESETGTKDIDIFDKLKKISEYVKIVKKYNELKKKKESFLSM